MEDNGGENPFSSLTFEICFRKGCRAISQSQTHAIPDSVSGSSPDRYNFCLLSMGDGAKGKETVGGETFLAGRRLPPPGSINHGFSRPFSLIAVTSLCWNGLSLILVEYVNVHPFPSRR